MIVVLIILSIGLLGVIIYFAISPKSSRLLRLSSIIALGIIALSLLVSGFFIIKGPSEEEAIIPLPVFSDTHAPPKTRFSVVNISVLAAFLAVIGLVMAKALKDQKKAQMPIKKFKPPEVFEDGDDLAGSPDDDLDYGQIKDDDESFDIGLD